MSWDEHIMLIAHTVNQYGDKIKVGMCVLPLWSLPAYPTLIWAVHLS